MIQKYIFLGISYLLSWQLTCAQDLNLKFEWLHTIKQNSHFMNIDPLQHLYIVDQEDQSIHKYSPKGELLYVYSNNNLGELGYLDAQNPMQILAYWKDYNEVVILDRTLSLRSQFNLEELGFYQVPAVCLSNDRHIWLYDPDNFRLVKTDGNGNILVESGDLSNLLGTDVNVHTLVEKDNEIYMNIPEEGIFVFDNLGNYEQQLHLKNISSFQVHKEHLFFLEENKLKAYHFPSFQTLDIPLETLKKGVLQIKIGVEYLFIRYSDRIETYKIKK